MAYNDWNRWTVGSLLVKVQTTLAIIDSDITIEVMTESLDRGDDPSQRRVTEKKGVELRYDGPWWSARPNKRADARFFVSLLLKYVPGNANIYAYPTLIGRMVEVLSDDLEIKKYGSEAGDDASSVACFVQHGTVKANNHGRRDVSANIFHASIQTEYHGDVKIDA